jgi:hypothetical protein
VPKHYIDECSALSLEKGRTPVLSATPWITDSIIVQNIVIIAIVSNLQRRSSYIGLQPTIHSRKHNGNEPLSSSCAMDRHVGM